jgi:hypothetical protein|tara:strand:+ start:872 stop:1054 length:183 start_codon:yes stop_codon:yes gene_type:complete
LRKPLIGQARATSHFRQFGYAGEGIALSFPDAANKTGYVDPSAIVAVPFFQRADQHVQQE